MLNVIPKDLGQEINNSLMQNSTCKTKLVNKFLVLYFIQRFITVLKTAPLPPAH